MANRMRLRPRTTVKTSTSLVVKVAVGSFIIASVVFSAAFIYFNLGSSTDSQAGNVNLNMFGSTISNVGIDGYNDDKEGISSVYPADSVYSIEAWINPSSISLGGIVTERIDYQSNSSYSLFTMPVEDELKLFFKVNDEHSNFHSTASIPVDEWTHIAVVFDGNASFDERKQIYINGELDSKGSSEHKAINRYTKSQFGVGKIMGNEDAEFDGEIDNIKFWMRSLSNNDFASVANEMETRNSSDLAQASR